MVTAGQPVRSLLMHVQPAVRAHLVLEPCAASAPPGCCSSRCGMLIQGAGSAGVVLSELDCMYVCTMRGFILVLEY